MIKFPRKFSAYLPFAILALLAVSVILLVYTGSIPDRYNLSPGVVSDIDISATRAVIDKAETELRAQESKAKIAPIYIRSEELSEKGVADLTSFFAICNEIRNNNKNSDGTVKKSYRDLSDSLISQVENSFGFTLTDDESFQIITSEQKNLDYVQSEAVSIASLILKDKVDDAELIKRIDTLTQEIDLEKHTNYVSNDVLVKSLLTSVLRPNAIYDEEATNAARLSAYNSELNDPVMIEKGSRIVSYGDVISNEMYQILLELDLIETTEFDYMLLIGISLYVTMILSLIGLYFKRFETDIMRNIRDLAALWCHLSSGHRIRLYLIFEFDISCFLHCGNRCYHLGARSELLCPF